MIVGCCALIDPGQTNSSGFIGASSIVGAYLGGLKLGNCSVSDHAVLLIYIYTSR